MQPEVTIDGRHGPNLRKATKPAEADSPAIEHVSGVWRIRSLVTARTILRARHQTTQAGFTAEYIPKGFLKHHPILISDGPLHDEQRSKVGRFFAPKVVDKHHLPGIEATADRLLAEAGNEFTLDDLALWFSVEVTSKIVGLTESPVKAMGRRLEAFFRQPPADLTKPDLGRTRLQWMQAAGRALVPLARFHMADVRPAIRARRRQPRADVISHLISEGYTNADILVECLTYGTAGMVTTREFITMAVWHLLDNPPLAARYREAGRVERHAILNEIIRLEPVVGHLYRRAQAPIEIGDGHTIQTGDLIDVCVRDTNTDVEVVGHEPLGLVPDRELPPGIDPSGLTFGDGAHRCPGQPLAITETDVLLTRLLAMDPQMVQRPELGWDDLIEGYRLRGLRLRLPAPENRRNP